MFEKASLVTIYVPCRDYGRFLEQCVESVFSQLYPAWELILINEGSGDDTVSICERFARRAPDRIKFLSNEKPIGLQRIANHISTIANGDYIMRLDADDWLHDGALLNLVANLDAHPQKNIAYGDYFYTNQEGVVLGSERRATLGHEDKVGHMPPHGACTLIRTRALKSVGGYDEDVNAQDGWDLWFKLGGLLSAINVGVPIFYYRQHTHSLSNNQGRLLNARSKIISNMATRIKGDYEFSNVAVIPVRESYPGFDKVPYQKYDGKTLLELALDSASKANNVSCVILASTSQAVLDFSLGLEKEGRVAAHLRLRREEATSITLKDSLVETLRSAGEFYFNETKRVPDTISFLSLHAVRRTSHHVEQALNVLRLTQADSVVSVQKEIEPVFTYGEYGLSLFNPGRFDHLEYDQERLYRFNGGLICSWWNIIENGQLIGEKAVPFEMTSKDSFQVKSPFDLKS
jgi:glycosyltransferase involved in cell wall biosynthesis